MPTKVPDVRRVDVLERDLREVRRAVTALTDARSFVVPITTLEPHPVELLRDIPVVIQPTGDDFVATFYDAGVSASGDTEDEAICNFKDLLAAKFSLLDSYADDRLAQGT